MININNIFKTYHLGQTVVHALKGISLSIDKGEIVCIMGPSGSGKTTLLNIIGCLDKPDSGDVFLNNKNIVDFNRNQLADIRANNIGFIFQSFNLISVLNVYENIELPLLIKKEKTSKIQQRKRILQLIEEVGLTEFIHHKPDELSGGQRQRVAIARALVICPEIILADEPTANLDSLTAQSILSIMKKLNQIEKVTFIFSTHDASISKYATKFFTLKDGILSSN